MPANCPPADVPPGVVQKAASDMTLSNMEIDDNAEKCEQEEWINRKLHCRGFVLTTSMGGKTVICENMTLHGSYMAVTTRCRTYCILVYTPDWIVLSVDIMLLV